MTAPSVYGLHRVGADSAGLKISAWMKKNICKDWRTLQKLFTKNRIWVLSTNDLNSNLANGNMANGSSSSSSSTSSSGGASSSMSALCSSAASSSAFASTYASSRAGSSTSSPKPGVLSAFPTVPNFAENIGSLDSYSFNDLKKRRKKTKGDHILQLNDRVVFPISVCRNDDIEKLNITYVASKKARRKLERSLSAGNAAQGDTKQTDLLSLAHDRLSPVSSFQREVKKNLSNLLQLQEHRKKVMRSSVSRNGATAARSGAPADQNSRSSDRPIDRMAVLRYIRKRILYEDQDFLILDKPVGVRWGASQGRSVSLFHILQQHREDRLKRSNEKRDKEDRNSSTWLDNNNSFVTLHGRETDELTTKSMKSDITEEEREAEEADELYLNPVQRLPIEMGGCMLVSKSASSYNMTREVAAKSFMRQKLVAVVRHAHNDIKSGNSLQHTSPLMRKKFGCIRIPMKFDPELKILVPAPPDGLNSSEEDDGKVETAVFHFAELRRVNKFGGLSLIEVIPDSLDYSTDLLTLRAALAFGLGTPVLGDKLYERAIMCPELFPEHVGKVDDNSMTKSNGVNNVAAQANDTEKWKGNPISVADTMDIIQSEAGENAEKTDTIEETQLKTNINPNSLLNRVNLKRGFEAKRRGASTPPLVVAPCMPPAKAIDLAPTITPKGGSTVGTHTGEVMKGNLSWRYNRPFDSEDKHDGTHSHLQHDQISDLFFNKNFFEKGRTRRNATLSCEFATVNPEEGKADIFDFAKRGDEHILAAERRRQMELMQANGDASNDQDQVSDRKNRGGRLNSKQSKPEYDSEWEEPLDERNEHARRERRKRASLRKSPLITKRSSPPGPLHKQITTFFGRDMGVHIFVKELQLRTFAGEDISATASFPDFFKANIEKVGWMEAETWV